MKDTDETRRMIREELKREREERERTPLQRIADGYQQNIDRREHERQNEREER